MALRLARLLFVDFHVPASYARLFLSEGWCSRIKEVRVAVCAPPCLHPAHHQQPNLYERPEPVGQLPSRLAKGQRRTEQENQVEYKSAKQPKLNALAPWSFHHGSPTTSPHPHLRLPRRPCPCRSILLCRASSSHIQQFHVLGVVQVRRRRNPLSILPSQRNWMGHR
jgi:hypothetical protein